MKRLNDTYYSVEYIWHSDPYGAWNQYELTQRRWVARLRAIELRATLGFSPDWKIRIRQL